MFSSLYSMLLNLSFWLFIFPIFIITVLGLAMSESFRQTAGNITNSALEEQFATVNKSLQRFTQLSENRLKQEKETYEQAIKQHETAKAQLNHHRQLLEDLSSNIRNISR